jgi:hypothetical protein
MRKIIFPFLFLTPCLLFAQTKPFVVEGKVTDILHNPVAYATIQNTATQEGANTDISGNYIFKTILPGTLKASFIGYKTELIKVSPENGKDTIKINFILETDSTQLQQVQVTATHEPELVTESGSLVDFDLSKGNLLLLYEHSHGDRVILFDTGMRTLATTQMKFHIDNLLRNEHYDIYFSHGDSIYFLYYNQVANSFGAFSLSESYYNSFQPVKAYNPPYYYYEHLLGMNAGVNYSYYNPKTKEQKILYSYFDNKLLGKTLEANEDILELEGEISFLENAPPAGERPLTVAAQINAAKGSARNITVLSTTIHSEITPVDDSIYIFNFNSDTFNIYDNQNNLARKLPMLFDKKMLAVSKQEILTDDDQKECYFKYEINGITYLEKIDLATGKALNLQSIRFPFIEKLRIFDGYAYYTYTSGGGAEIFLLHLYRQKIN